MNPQPRFLQQIISLFPVRHLALEESEQSRAKGANQSCRRFRIGLLVALHPAIEVAERLSWYNVLLETGPHLPMIRDSKTWSYGPLKDFFGDSRQSGHPSVYTVA